MKFKSNRNLWTALFLSVSLYTSAEVAAIEIDYQAADKNLLIKQCFAQSPAYMYSADKQTTAATRNLKWQNKPVSAVRGYVKLPLGEAGCLSYEILPKHTLSNSRSSSFKAQHPNGLLLAIEGFLWQTSDKKTRKLPLIKISHDEYTQISAPWQLISRHKNQTIYQQKPSPKYAKGFVAFGPMNIRDIQLGQSRLRLAILNGQHASKPAMIEEWITKMAASVAKVGASFPLDDIQVLVVMLSGSGRAVPWGQVGRAGGQGVLLLVNPEKSKSQLFSDWTAAHEFSHLLMPFTPNDRWLSEGFASYHQNISRLRAGLLDESSAWSKILSGFERGETSAAKASAPKLKQAGRNNNMQMYWGGAVIALKADVALQQQTAGQMSLSTALTGLQNCCLDTGKAWSARDLFAELDEITDSDVFTTLYEQEVKKNSFPEFKQLLLDLGIKPSVFGGVVLNDEAPLAQIRAKIAKG